MALSAEEKARILAMAEQASRHIASPSGQRSLGQRLRNTDEIARSFKKARELSWEDLHTPMDI